MDLEQKSWVEIQVFLLKNINATDVFFEEEQNESDLLSR